MWCQVYTTSRQGETYVCLVNETAKEVVIGDKELLGEHIPSLADDMVTLGELLTVRMSNNHNTREEPRPLTKGRMQRLMTRIQRRLNWLRRTLPRRVRSTTMWLNSSRTPHRNSRTSNSNNGSSTTSSSRIYLLTSSYQIRNRSRGATVYRGHRRGRHQGRRQGRRRGHLQGHHCCL